MKSIQLANPCSEHWEQMQPAAHGRFCDHCQKQVHDMTGLSTTEVIQLFQKNGGKLCGRMTETQLKQHNSIIEKQSFFRFSKITKSISAFSVVAMAFVTMPFKKSYATNHEVVTQPILFLKESNPLPKPPPLDSARTLKVKVVDESGEAIVGADVEVLDSLRKPILETITDMDGNAEIYLKLNVGYITFEFLGMIKDTVQYNLSTTDFAKVMKEDENIEFEVRGCCYSYTPRWKRIAFFPYYQTKRLYRKVRYN